MLEGILDFMETKLRLRRERANSHLDGVRRRLREGERVWEPTFEEDEAVRVVACQG